MKVRSLSYLIIINTAVSQNNKLLLSFTLITRTSQGSATELPLCTNDKISAIPLPANRYFQIY